MPPKKRNPKPKDLQDVPAWKPTHRRTPARRCQNLSTDEERREAQATPPPSTSGSQKTKEDYQALEMKPQAVKNAEEESIRNSPTPLADTATSFADTADFKIPSKKKIKRNLPTSSCSPASRPEPKIKIPANANKSESDLPTSMQPEIPMIRTKLDLDWTILNGHIMQKLGTKEPPAAFKISDGECYLDYYPRTEWEYNVIWNQIIEDNATIVGPPRWQPTKEKPLNQSSMPTSLKPPKPAPRDASPARTPTPLLSANASRDGSTRGTPTPTPSVEEEMIDALPARMPTPNMSANDYRDDSPTYQSRTPTPA
ncbi:hypothetical protein ACJJTC_012080, partial [Scirpophaga incertulas]